MRYRKIERTGFEVSELCLGTWPLGGGNDWTGVSYKDAMEAIECMLDNGVNFIDTAPTYGLGEAERRLGEALKGKRDKVILQTKFGSHWPHKEGKLPGDKPFHDGRKETVYEMIDESLERLQTDYIDIYMMHWPDTSFGTPFEETAEALTDLKQQGKIRFVGVSNFELYRLEDAEKLDIIDFVQYGHSMVDQKSRPQLEWCAARGITTESYGTLGAGMLTGKFREFVQFDPMASRYRFYKFFQQPYFDRCQELLKVMDGIAAEKNVPLSHIAINWSLSKPYMDTVVCGVSNAKQAQENLRAMDVTLTEDEIATLDAAIAKIELP